MNEMGPTEEKFLSLLLLGFIGKQGSKDIFLKKQLLRNNKVEV
jgi:hypothetical protein